MSLDGTPICDYQFYNILMQKLHLTDWTYFLTLLMKQEFQNTFKFEISASWIDLGGGWRHYAYLKYVLSSLGSMFDRHTAQERQVCLCWLLTCWILPRIILSQDCVAWALHWFNLIYYFPLISLIQIHDLSLSKNDYDFFPYHLFLYLVLFTCNQSGCNDEFQSWIHSVLGDNFKIDKCSRSEHRAAMRVMLIWHYVKTRGIPGRALPCE